ncbi:hypothetical protein PF005_g1352 [Phytophthora fragariae]|uniref:Transposase IS30-like HTH domain-containing protein n=1 Tax=Phytophthora fragariae TaxID=53985 RepID=A0A6A4AJ02_9STRA|nr:hypothetical protein PF003_g20901 [Phytophthora fragariae]KAE8949059.1 hypothetical protein PF009_g1408 [Phytophthora fragariae]KAE9029900.1 hypothetical protein PF011_g876 [Phytophthora fragariae]KAE9137985.1 hypothetical protein PF010_g1084 [Phytophthora fragariae]KAE9138522.1 hypothetical protein PF007_g1353 [Phytophthora fragariae]
MERERGSIIGLRKGRRSIHGIAALTKRSQGTVSRVIREGSTAKSMKPKKPKPRGGS